MEILRSMDNANFSVYFLIFLACTLLIILYRVFGTRHGHERKRDIKNTDPNIQVEDILKEMRKIITDEKTKDKDPDHTL